jgi:hypothetical protein
MEEDRARRGVGVGTEWPQEGGGLAGAGWVGGGAGVVGGKDCGGWAAGL